MAQNPTAPAEGEALQQPNLTATLRALAIYCFQKHGNDAYLYNALADLVGPEAMRGVPSSPAQEKRLRHGRDCPKVPHVGDGYLHHADDDGFYDVDGVSYCGRCHGWMGSAPSPSAGAAQKNEIKKTTI